MDVVRLLIGAIIICAFLSVIYWLFRAAKKENKKYCEMKALAEKHFELYMLMTYWTRMSIEGKKTSDYFKERDIRDIAIYGMNYVGETLLKDLNNTGVEVKYGIDRNYSAISSSIRIFSPQQNLQEVGAIVVTPISSFDQIEYELSKKFNCPIISIEDIIYTL